MPNHSRSESNEFLDVVSPTDTRSLHRSRSGGYTDFLADKEKWERRHHEQKMKKYHESRYAESSLSPTADQRRISADRLYVPTFDTSHRRVRSYDQIVERKAEEGVETERGYRVREERPSSYDGSGGLSGHASELPVRTASTKRTRPRKPSIKVQIHQDDAPRSPLRPRSATTPRKNPSVSPRASPRSPSARPQLLLLSATLQSRLSEIESICEPQLHVEAADPRDLTFSKIAEEVEGFAFQFRLWSQIVNLENMEKIEVSKRKAVELAAGTLERIIERVDKMIDVCAKATPTDLKIEAFLEVDDEEESGSDQDQYSDDEEDEVIDVTASPGFVIQSHLDSIRVQMQILSRMTRALQEATPNAKAEVVAVGDLVAEVDKFFGSPDALARHGFDRSLSGREALEEARYAAERNRGPY